MESVTHNLFSQAHYPTTIRRHEHEHATACFVTLFGFCFTAPSDIPQNVTLEPASSTVSEDSSWLMNNSTLYMFAVITSHCCISNYSNKLHCSGYYFQSIIIRWEPPPKESQNGIITGYKVRYKLKGSRRGDTITTDGNRRLYALSGESAHA